MACLLGTAAAGGKPPIRLAHKPGDAGPTAVQQAATRLAAVNTDRHLQHRLDRLKNEILCNV